MRLGLVFIEEDRLWSALSHICDREKGGAGLKEPGPVIFASGGFATDFTLNSMLVFFVLICAPSHNRR